MSVPVPARRYEKFNLLLQGSRAGIALLLVPCAVRMVVLPAGFGVVSARREMRIDGSGVLHSGHMCFSRSIPDDIIPFT
jgi:hypothetical protein